MLLLRQRLCDAQVKRRHPGVKQMELLVTVLFYFSLRLFRTLSFVYFVVRIGIPKITIFFRILFDVLNAYFC